MVFNIIVIFLVVFDCKENIRKFLIPGNIFFLYTSSTFVLGEIWFVNNWVYDQKYVVKYASINENLSLILGLLLLLSFVAYKLFPKFALRLHKNYGNKELRFTPLIVVFLLLPFLSILLEIFGFFGNIYTYYFIYVFTYIISYKIVRIRNVRLRYLALLSLFLMGIPLFYSSKRDLIFLILPLLVYEIKPGSLSLKRLVKIVFAGLLLLTFIFAMSILRGYGEYEITSYLDLVLLVPQYILQDSFLAYLGSNIEVVYAYFHTLNALNAWIVGDLPLMYGSTLIKVFFVPIPSSVMAGPQSIISVYTNFWSPGYRSAGGSYPINMVGEYILNFGYLSILVLGGALKIFDSFFITWLNDRQASVLLSLVFMNLLVLFRGSGLDLFVASLVILIAIYLLHYLITVLVDDLFVPK